MESENAKATITINPADFLRPLQSHLIECSNAVFTGLSILEQLEQLPDAIPGEDNFSLHQPFGYTLRLEDQKRVYRRWLIKKGFEDLIKAVTSMLIDMVKVLRVAEKFKQGKKTLDEFRQILLTPDYEPYLMHFPELLNIVRPYLSGNLLYENEIHSINRVRRCLVHRSGVVTPKDFNENSNTLNLHWIYLKFFVVEDGKEDELKFASILTGASTVQGRFENRSQAFAEGQQIEITYQMFNELMFTCLQFGDDLITKFTIK